MSKVPILLFANHSDADFYYCSHFKTPDRYFLLSTPGQKAKLFVGQLEYGRAEKESECDVILIERTASQLTLMLDITKDYNEIYVPFNFPAGLYELLSEHKKVLIQKDPVFPEREIKTLAEKQKLIEANNVSKRCFDRIKQILKESTIGVDDVLIYRGAPLTSEALHEETNQIIMQHGGSVDEEQIIAPHTQACDPHCAGTGVLRAHQSLVCDIFPRSANRYFADMTRTFCKGRPSAELVKLHDLVLKVQQEAIKRVKPGVSLLDLQQFCSETFEKEGFGVKMENDVPEGFIHGLSHGVGIEIHELPHISRSDTQGNIIKQGQVFSVEPGLYFMDIGGCRIEDCVFVTADGAEVISEYDYDWIIE